MNLKIILLTFFMVSCVLSFSQPDLSDLEHDSTEIFKTTENLIHQIDYYSKGRLVMQKFYPKGNSIGGSCYGTNLVYDSVLVQLGDLNYVTNFSRGGKSYTNYSWQDKSNILNINTLNMMRLNSINLN